MLSGIPPTPCTFSCLSVPGASGIIVRWAMGLPSGTPKFSVTIPLSYLSVPLIKLPSQFLVLAVVRTLAIQLSLISGAYRVSFSVLGDSGYGATAEGALSSWAGEESIMVQGALDALDSVVALVHGHVRMRPVGQLRRQRLAHRVQ